MVGTKRGRGGARKTGKSRPTQEKPAPPEPSQGSATLHSDSADEDFLPSPTVLRSVRARTAAFRSSGAGENVASERPLNDLVYVASPGFSRYQTRYSRSNLGQSAKLSLPLKKPIRNVLRVTQDQEFNAQNGTHQQPHSGNEDNATPELQHCSSKQTHDDLVSQAPAGSPRQLTLDNIDNTEEDHSSPVRRANNTKVANSSNCKSTSGPFLDCPDPIICQPVKHIDIQVPLSQSHKGRPEKSTTNIQERQSEAHSFNLTEYARGLHDNMEEDPDEEVESSLEPGFQLVRGHKVRTETVPLLECIFTRHGDITSETHLESPISISNSLEQLCGVCGRLQQARFVDLTRIELESMLADVRDVERTGLRIVWLRERLEFISRAWMDYSKYFHLKELVAENDVSIGGLEKELDTCKQQQLEMQRRISALEDELAARRERTEVARNAIVSTRARVQSLVNRSLVDGLL
ncbi:Unknown protein [Striga hermonthica]|uniref:Uncharacterized protein n=1 Tax=Striga hermonthica TaxID=68872 RepID=A0A9N7RC64_STRHE|nr:Unknown protein [Striga hermonthica]